MPDRNGKIFYTSITSLSHISKDGGKIAECEVTVSDIMGYVLDTADATSGLMGEDARIKLLLQDGTVKAFEADRDCHYSSDSDVITADGRWNVNTGSIIRFGTDAEGRINEIERKSIPGTNVNASITIRGYFDGFKVSDDAFIVLYSEKSSSDSDHYKVIPLDNILETTATDVDYSLNNNHSIDFMLIKYVPVNSVQLDKTSITMEAGSHVNLVAAIEPDTANIRGVSWHSSDTSVVTVGNDGLVTALKPGNATVTAISIDNEAMASCDVIVTESVSTITLNKTEISLYEGSEEILYYSISPGNFESIVNWSSSDQRIATASREGLVSAVSAGTAIITAQLENGKKAAACTVTVKSTTLYGVIVDVTRTSNDYGYEIEVLINGESRNYESINLLEADMTQLYRLNLNQAGVVIGIDPIDPNLIISGSEIVSISDGMLRYGEPEMLAFLSSDVVVYIADQDGEYENGSVNDIPGSNAYFYDIDDDRIYDIVLLPPV